MDLSGYKYARDIMLSYDFSSNHVEVKTENQEKEYDYISLVVPDSYNNIVLFDDNDQSNCKVIVGRNTEINGIRAEIYGYNDDTDDISEGCYLTTACVDYFGKPDDCFELETLRHFRDGYMQTTNEMKQAARKYYIIAPKIVKKIDSLPNKASVYKEMYKNLVQKCVSLINMGKNKEAYESYKNYSENLEKKYLKS